MYLVKQISSTRITAIALQGCEAKYGLTLGQVLKKDIQFQYYPQVQYK